MSLFQIYGTKQLVIAGMIGPYIPEDPQVEVGYILRRSIPDLAVLFWPLISWPRQVWNSEN